jgi:succinate dehydrogenase / fumarate reductase cytochrome b subunit
LQIYRWQVPMLTSILTRITGHALVAGVLLGVWWLLAAATSEAYFATADAVATSWFGDLVFTGSLWAVWYHYLSGLRHLYYDAGHGLDIPTAEKLGWACIIGSVVLTVITILLVQ